MPLYNTLGGIARLKNRRLRVLYGTAAEWAAQDPVLLNGELAYDTTNNTLRVGPGLWSTRSNISGGSYTDEQAQDALGTMLDTTLEYVDATPLLRRAALTGDITASAGSNATTLANDAVTYAKMQNVSATSRVIGRKTAGAGDPEELTLSEVLDLVGSAAQGDVLYRGAATWARLAAGTSGQVLKTQGSGANPTWVSIPQRISKASDETVNDLDVLQDDNDLTWTIATGKSQAFRLVIHATTTSTAGFQYRLDYSATPTLWQVSNRVISGTGTAFSNISYDTTEGTKSVTVLAGTGVYAEIEGMVYNNTGSTITIKLQWAQGLATVVDTHVRRTSYVEYLEQ